MLSYVLPVEEKVLREDEERSPGSETRPLLAGTTDGASLTALQHALTHAAPPVDKANGQDITTTTVDVSTTTSSTTSAATSPAPVPHAPQTAATAKPSLKRVSFGSSKGSMVETLIYDSPVGEEERIPEEEDTQVTSPSAFKDPVSQKFGTETGAQQKPASKVRVTFYESSRPLVVTSPEPSDLDLYSPDLLMASPPADPAMPGFDRQLSTESGRDNPFRPGGDISKEADQIVEAIKSGRPLLTPDTTDTPTAPTPTTDAQIIPTQAPTSLQAQSPPESPISKGGNAGVNGSTPAEAPQSNSGTVEVKHVTVTPSDQGHVERVVIKKKNKCSCCVIQ
ncbi:mucin-5AC-like isoform X3 [Portunus trituberculatus]|nr:mucin-5AC-like isoform X3 [Portunus trituberculatus]XP_045113068.1 mucin-5AC-like isoform X3 [Portunus trituberculatus]XP_045113075.1 mucin-5AC-like isoform X3 [Portunus trituberculatus]